MTPEEQEFYEAWKARALVFLAALQADFPLLEDAIVIPIAANLAIGSGHFGEIA